LFVGRQTELRAIRDYLQNDSPWPLMVYGASGCGKTALLARAAEEIQESEVSGQKPEVILRFIGVTPRSSDIRSLLGSLCQELRLRHPRELPTETKALSEELQEHFRSATPEQPLFLFLDALDQLSDADNGRLLNWLPRGQLPGHVKLVVSCLSDRAKDDQAGQPFAELTRRHLPAQNIINLDALSEDEAGTLLFDRWLPEAGRTVSRNQRERIWQRLESKDCRQPIYLKLLFEEARTLRSYDAAHELGESVPAILGQLIERLSRPANHGRLLVERLLGYLAASRHGLAENEILEVLFADAEYKAALDQATEQTHHELPASATRIPIAIWSRLRFDLAPYLTERAAPGANVLTFYHRQVAEWVQEHFVKASDHSWQPHRRLADYFRSHADPERNQTWKGNSPRPFLELPFHIGHAEIWSELVAVLEDIFFLEAKNSHGLAFALVGDFTTALRQLPRDHSQYRILNLLEEALRRDINFIARHARDYPQALFQCLWNSCWWFDCQLSERHYEMPNTGWSNTDPPWNRSGGKLCQLMERWRAEREAHISGFFWLRSLRPPPTELSCGFNGVLQGHVDQVLSMGVSRDGSRIATVSMNHETSIWTVHLWDAKTHQHLGTIENSTEPVDGAFSSVARVALSPDGSKVAVGCSKVSLYDFALCTVIGSLADCGTKVCSLAYSHDGRWIATGSEDGTARLWDTRTLELVRTFGRHAAVVDLVAFSPDGRCLATAGSRAIGIWEIDTGSSLNVIEEFDEIKALTFSPDGTRIAYGRDDGCVKICDTFTDKVPVRIQAHRRPIRGVAFVNGAHAVVTAAFEDLVNIWDAREGNLLESFSCGTEGATSLAVLPDGETIVAGSAAGPLWIWTKTGFGHGAELRGSGKAKGMWQSPNGQRLVSSMADGSIIFWDAQSALLLRSIKAGGSPYRFLGFSANGERFATLHRGRVEIWNTAAVKEVAWFELSQDEHDCVSFSPKGLALATWRKAGGNRKESWSVISAWTGPLIPLVDFKAHSDIIRGVTILDDEHTLVSASADGLVCLWSGTNGQIHFRWDLGHDIEKIAVSPGSRFSVCIGFYGTSVTVFDLVKGTRLPELEGLQLPCANVKFESEGEQMATIPRTNSTFLADKSDVNKPNEIQIWNLRNGKCLRTESVSADDFSLSYFMSQGSTATSESIFTKAGSGKPVGWFPVALSAMPGDQGRRWYGHAVRGGTTDERNLFVLTLESTDAD
jgi:WD40 repeat protein